MASDFDRDEIQDASFPIEFKDETQALDMFGVWVKSGPRDAYAKAEPTTAPAGQTEPKARASLTEETFGSDEFADIGDLPDLPDFDASSDEIVSEESFSVETFADESPVPASSQNESAYPSITFEEILTESVPSRIEVVESKKETIIEEMDEFPDIGDAAMQETEESVPSVADISDIDLASFLDISFDSAVTAREPEPPESELKEDEFPDIETDESADFGEITSFDEIAPVAYSETAAAEPEDIGETIQEEISEDALPETLDVTLPESFDETFTETVSGNFSLDEDITFGDEPAGEEIADQILEEEAFSFDEIADDADSYIPTVEPDTDPSKALSIESEAPAFEPAADTTEDIDFSSFLDDLDAAEGPQKSKKSGTEANAALPSDDDFSSFLDDLNSGAISDGPAPVRVAASGADDLDLDDFINAVNESGTPLKEDADKVFSDTEPVDIDLEFDETYIEDVEKIRATGAMVSESEFFNSEFGVEMVDMSSESAGPDSFESAFDSIPDITEEPVARAAPAKDSGISLQETNEFDDLLSSLDLEPAPAAVAAKTVKTGAELAKKQSYELSVIDEGEETFSATVSDTSVDDDIIVSLKFDATATEANDRPATPAVTHADHVAETSVDGSVETALADFFVNEEPVSPEETIEDESFGSMPDLADDAFADETISLELSPDSTIEFSPDSTIEENLDIPEIRDYNNTDSVQGTDKSAVFSMEDDVSLEFDDISAVEKELNDFIPDSGEAKVITNDKSTELLMIIADELSSIKKELSTLKTEIAGFKGGVPEQSAELAADHGAENSGFFTDDDNDETIALTGDELNNILITADFTEEKNTETDISEEAIPEMELNVGEAVQEDIPLSMPDFGAEAFTGQDSPEEPEIPDTLPDSILEMPSVEPMAVEVSHVTTIDEDTSYLDGSDTSEANLDNVAIEEPELEIIDFDDEKLEEPELTEFNLDLTDIETEFPVEQEVSVPSEEIQEAAPEPAIIEDSIPVIDEAAEEKAAAPSAATETGVTALPVDLKDEIKSVLSYMDQLLESLPEEKIEEFARSEHFETYKKLFEELGIS